MFAWVRVSDQLWDSDQQVMLYQTSVYKQISYVWNVEKPDKICKKFLL